MKFSIGKKLSLAFGAIIVLSALSSVIVFINIQSMRSSVHEVVNEATPSLRTCDVLLSSLHQSAAALRGYLALGHDERQAAYFRKERAAAWKAIDDAYSQLAHYAPALGDDSQRRIAAMATLLDKVRSAQQDAEDVGQTDDNIPSLRLLLTEFMPHAARMLDLLTALMKLETSQNELASPSQNLIRLANLRFALSAGLFAALGFQLTGEEDHWLAEKASWNEFEAVFNSINGEEAQWTGEERFWNELSSRYETFNMLPDEHHALRSSPDWNRSEFILATRSAPLAAELKSELQAVMQSAEERNTALREQMDAAGQLASATLVVATLAATVLAIVVAVLLSRHLVNTLRALSLQAGAIAAGDLRGRVLTQNSKDELGQLADGFNVMLANLKELTAQVLVVTENVNSATSQISSSASQQATSTRQQASTAAEITSTMREISQTGAQILDRAQALSAAAEASTQASREGLMAVQEAGRTMEAIRAQVEDVAQNIVALSEKTQAVGEIVATVNDVAEQSNLLALNATIEAASAGEQGLRFSVVANEMKNLADQARQCTVQVRDLLSEIQRGINSSVMLTEEAVKRVESGKQRTQFTEEAIRQISHATDESVQAFQQIIGATNQQQIGVEQVAQGMEEIREATQQTASGTSQLEQAVISLSALSRQLTTAVGRYQL